MRKALFVSMLAALFSMTSARAADMPEPRTTTTPVPGIAYRCHFGKDHGQKDDLKCFVRGLLCSEFKSSGGKGCHSYDDPIEIRCTNGFKFHSEDAAVAFDEGTLWINASKWHKIVTLKIEDIKGGIESENNHEHDSTLVVANRLDFDLEGKCKLFPTGHQEPDPAFEE